MWGTGAELVVAPMGKTVLHGVCFEIGTTPMWSGVGYALQLSDFPQCLVRSHPKALLLCCCCGWRQRCGGARFFVCPQSEGRRPSGAPHLHGPSPHGEGMAQTKRQRGGLTWRSTPVPAILGNGGVSCSAQQNLGTAAKMGGAGRRQGKRYAPADAFPEAPASWT